MRNRELEGIDPDSEMNRRYASFTMLGATLDPEQITPALGLTPDRASKAGDLRGKTTSTWQHGFWSISTENEVQSQNLEEHIARLLDKLEPVSRQLAAIRESSEIHARVFCFWETNRMNDGIELSPDLMGRLARLNLQVGIDIYNSELHG